MSDFTPAFKPGAAVTFTASAAVTGGQLVEVTGDMTVGPAGADSTKVVGQPGHDAAAGETVTVHLPGKTVTSLTAAGDVTAGDHVKAGAAGTGAVFVAGTDDDTTRFGLALQSATAGQTYRVLPA